MKKVFTHMLIPKKSVGFRPQLGGMCLFLLASFLVLAQELAVSGTVKDESGRPLLEAVLVNSASDGGNPVADGRHFTCQLVKSELNQI